MNIYSENDYRDVLRATFAAKKKAESGLTHEAIGKICKVQKTFVSRVFNKQAHFNRDQLYAVNEFFNFDHDTHEFLVALLDFARSYNKSHQRYLKDKIAKIRAQKKDTRTYIGEHKIEVKGQDERYAAYYLEPFFQIVHIALGIPKYQDNYTLLTQDLGLGANKLESIINALCDMKLLSRENKKITVLETEVYLAKDSSYYSSWRSLIRSLTASKLQELTSGEAYSFSGTIAASAAVKEEIQEKFMELLKTIRPAVVNAPCEDVFQLNFDLFSWIKK